MIIKYDEIMNIINNNNLLSRSYKNTLLYNIYKKMPSNEVSNLIKRLVANQVLNNATTTSNFPGSLPNPFYYKGSDLKTECEFSVTIPQYQGTFTGACFLDIQTLKLYDQITHAKIGTVTFHDYYTKSSTSQAVVNEKIIFNFDSIDNSSITAEYSFLSDDIFYPSTKINQRIIAGTGSYLNLYGYNISLEKKADNNRYISVVHN